MDKPGHAGADAAHTDAYGAADAALARRAAHWRQTRRLTALLLALWFVTGFGTVFFARELYQYTLFGWPLSFYMAAQGSSLVYLAIIGVYAWRMRRLDLAATTKGPP